jgi:hypothetical protein
VSAATVFFFLCKDRPDRRCRLHGNSQSLCCCIHQGLSCAPYMHNVPQLMAPVSAVLHLSRSTVELVEQLNQQLCPYSNKPRQDTPGSGPPINVPPSSSPCALRRTDQTTSSYSSNPGKRADSIGSHGCALPLISAPFRGASLDASAVVPAAAAGRPSSPRSPPLPPHRSATRHKRPLRPCHHDGTVPRGSVGA